MSKEDKYFTFPLAVLQGNKEQTTALECLELAIRCGVWNAGIGFRKTHGEDTFEEWFTEARDQFNVTRKISSSHDHAYLLVGAKVCNITMGGSSPFYFDNFISDARSVKTGGPLVKIAAKHLWAAVSQSRAEADPSNPWPDHGMSWREFRILCAILSEKVNRSGFAFIGWETIQARSCGFTTKDSFKKADTIPDHLAPALTRKQIRPTCDALEDLGFYARFHMSSGSRGGLMAYSVRHNRDDLAKSVCDFMNFRDRAKIKANRANDAKKCLELLERAKVRPRLGQQGGQGGGQGGGQHKDKYSE